MKSCLLLAAVIICSFTLFGQANESEYYKYSGTDVRYKTCDENSCSSTTKIDIEHAFNSMDFNRIESMLSSSMGIRIDEKLYKNLNTITAIDVIKNYLLEKDAVSFKYISGSSWEMTYTKDNVSHKSNVDILTKSGNLGISIYAINFSNHPLATAFFD